MLETPNKLLLSKEEYDLESKFINFSGLKVFSKCETLYRDIFVTKVYKEPERDYFLYGKLVDALVTETPQYIKDHFILVDKKVKPEDALKYENEIKTLENEIEATKEKCEAGNKTAIKGRESRLKKIEELQLRLSAIRDIDGKEQITNSIWVNAEETALALKTHPHYSNLEFNEFTSQQILVASVGSAIRKGRLDHLKLCPQIEKLYRLYVAKQISYEEMTDKITAMDQSELWAVITDIKTCYDIAKLEPYSTHWRGQLGFYQDIVSEFFLIPRKQIKCQILVADKLSSTFKKSELFEYSQESLDELKPDVEAWIALWQKAKETNTFVSAKERKGMKQECYTCQECRNCPFSMKPGQPVMVTEPRFATKFEAGTAFEGENEETYSDTSKLEF
jgi:hypothetical protein